METPSIQSILTDPVFVAQLIERLVTLLIQDLGQEEVRILAGLATSKQSPLRRQEQGVTGDGIDIAQQR